MTNTLEKQKKIVVEDLILRFSKTQEVVLANFINAVIECNILR